MSNSKYLSNFRKTAQKMANGCPLMDGRNKANTDDYVNEALTLEDAYKLKGAKGDYYVVIVKEHDDVFFMSGGALTAILDSGDEIARTEGVPLNEVVGGLEFSFGEKIKTKNGNDFRPIKVY